MPSAKTAAPSVSNWRQSPACATLPGMSKPAAVPVPPPPEDPRLAQLRADIQAGDEQWDRGEHVDGEAFFAELWEEHKREHGQYPDQE